ncbi:MAG: cobalt ECF transporter T component CbiQ [Planctomycetota bacterium]|nr:cobalt ECF transporter T component CbiQ [Planctomycetota bacterium]
MFELFSDIMACRPNALTRVDARVKLVSGVAALVVVLFSTRLALPLAILAACLVAMLALRLPLRLTLLRLAAPLLVVLILMALQAFTQGSKPLFSLTVGGFRITATEEGTWRAALLGSRVLGGVSVMLLLSAVTPAHQLFHALRWCGVPKTWVEVALLMYRYIFVLLDEAGDVATAQRVRLGYATLSRSLSSLGVLSGIVIVRSLDQSARTHEAMTLRGYKGTMPLGPLPRLSRSDRLALLIAPLLMAGLFCLAEYAPLPSLGPPRAAPVERGPR